MLSSPSVTPSLAHWLIMTGAALQSDKLQQSEESQDVMRLSCLAISSSFLTCHDVFYAKPTKHIKAPKCRHGAHFDRARKEDEQLQ